MLGSLIFASSWIERARLLGRIQSKARYLF